MPSWFQPILKSCFRVETIGFLFLILVLRTNAFPQQGLQKTDFVPAPNLVSAKLRRELAVSRVKGFAGRILTLQDVPARVRALARLGDLLWKDDEIYARQLFSMALNLCSPLKVGSSHERQSMADLRRQVITAIAKRDAALAKNLAAEDSNGVPDGIEATNTNFEVADKLVKSKPDSAEEFARRSLKTGVSPWMGIFLTKLRFQNASAADQLFLMTLERLSAESVVAPDTLLLLGTYVFTFHTSESDPPAGPGTIKYVAVGPLLLVDITADLPNIPPQLIIAYLRTATEIISRPMADLEFRAKYYAAAYLLLNKTQKFAPDLTPRLGAAMLALSESVPADLTRESTYENFSVRPPKSLEESIKEVEKNGDSHHRDAIYLALVSYFWTKSDFTKARTVNDKISDSDVRDRLASLIDFGDATQGLKNGKPTLEVEKICEKLQPRIERAVLRLGIANASSTASRPSLAIASIHAALADARKINDVRSPFISLNAAGQLAPLDADAATAAMAEAVAQFNFHKSADIEWQERVEAGVLWRYFPLNVKGINLEFSHSISILMRVNPEGTIEAMSHLVHEEQLAPALTEIAAVLLK